MANPAAISAAEKVSTNPAWGKRRGKRTPHQGRTAHDIAWKAAYVRFVDVARAGVALHGEPRSYSFDAGTTDILVGGDR